jgi:hypothetical protein
MRFFPMRAGAGAEAGNQSGHQKNCRKQRGQRRDAPSVTSHRELSSSCFMSLGAEPGFRAYNEPCYSQYEADRTLDAEFGECPHWLDAGVS